jgi:hypothetical protein
MAVDCDGDAPLAFRLERLGGSLTCFGEEEFWEFTGDPDIAGPSFVVLSPAQWVGGGSFVLRPVPEFTANISISVTP